MGENNGSIQNFQKKVFPRIPRPIEYIDRRKLFIDAEPPKIYATMQSSIRISLARAKENHGKFPISGFFMDF
jgi:hypothetical protein